MTVEIIKWVKAGDQFKYHTIPMQVIKNEMRSSNEHLIIMKDIRTGRKYHIPLHKYHKVELINR